MIHVPSLIDDVLEAITPSRTVDRVPPVRMITEAELELFVGKPDDPDYDPVRAAELTAAVARIIIYPDFEAIDTRLRVEVSGESLGPNEISLAWGYRGGVTIQANSRYAVSNRQIELTLWGRENDSDLLHLYYYRIQTYLQNHPAVGDIDVPVSGFILQDNITLLLRFTFELKQ